VVAVAIGPVELSRCGWSWRDEVSHGGSTIGVDVLSVLEIHDRSLEMREPCFQIGAPLDQIAELARLGRNLLRESLLRRHDQIGAGGGIELHAI
jgi:hypothetical protein